MENPTKTITCIRGFRGPNMTKVRPGDVVELPANLASMMIDSNKAIEGGDLKANKPAKPSKKPKASAASAAPPSK